MPRFLDNEQAQLRRTYRTAEGTVRVRVYHDSPKAGDTDGIIPAEGDPLPGYAVALLGPFVVRGGIHYHQTPGAAFQAITLTSLTLRTTATVAAYTELDRRVVGKRANMTVRRTIGIALASTEATAPKVGDLLSGTGETIAPVCVSVDLDTDSYPQRTRFVAVWESPQVEA